MVIGTCGHQLTEKEAEGFRNYISIMDHDRTGNKAVSYMTVCDECKKKYAEKGLILRDEKDINDYFFDIIKYPDDKDQDKN